MKALIRNIWDAKASTAAAAIIAGLAVLTAADAGLPKPWVVGLSCLAAVLSLFSGPNTPNQ